MSKNGLIILAPNMFGDYAICIAEMLAREGIATQAIFVRRLVNLKRLRQEIRAEGLPAFARKVSRKLLFRGTGNADRGHDTIAKFKRREGIGFTSLKEFAEARGAEIHECRDFNEEAICNEIRRLQPSAAVFTGGGLLRTRLLEACERRIIGCHPGLLPEYRGMDCLEWAMLEGWPAKMGFTTFLIDEGVDTGPILQLYPVEPEPTDPSFQTLRERLEPIMCRGTVETVLAFLNDNLAPRGQALDAGRQYFTMHPVLQDKTAALLQEALRP